MQDAYGCLGQVQHSIRLVHVEAFLGPAHRQPCDVGCRRNSFVMNGRQRKTCDRQRGNAANAPERQRRNACCAHSHTAAIPMDNPYCSCKLTRVCALTLGERGVDRNSVRSHSAE